MAKDKHEELRKRIEEIQRSRMGQYAGTKSTGPSQDISKIVPFITPILTTMQSASDGVMTYHQFASGFYVSYAYTHTYGILIYDDSPNSIRIEGQIANFQQNPTNIIIYKGGLNRKDIETAVERALTEWFSSFQ